jgi:hypothetical protein
VLAGGTIARQAGFIGNLCAFSQQFSFQTHARRLLA